MKVCNPNCNYQISQDMSERINIFRLILTIMVIYIHSYGSVSLFSEVSAAFESARWLNDTKYIISQIITRSAVPGFFLLSSILLYRKPFNWTLNIKKKLKSLAIPYLILNCSWILLFFVLQSLSFSSGIFNNPENYVRSWDLRQWCNALFGVPNNVVPFLYPLWFLRDLLILNFFSYVIWKLVDKIPELMLAGALYLWFFRSIPNSAVPDYQAVAFWIIGAYIVKRNLHLEKLDKIPKILVIAILAVCINKLMPDRYAEKYIPLMNLCVSLSLLLTFILCETIRRTDLNKLLLSLSTYSFSIYLFHEFTTLFFRKLAASILPGSVLSQFLQYMLIPFAVAAFCILLSIILKKIMPRFYQILTGGR